MKVFHRILLLTLLLIACLLLVRGWTYGQLVTYRSIGERPSYTATDPALIEYIEQHAPDIKRPDAKAIMQTSLSVTSQCLRFTTDRNENDPNKLIRTQTAHCVGYAAFCSATCNYLLKKHNLSDTWTATPQIGQLYLLGTNVHRYFDSPFMKDHDFVLLRNKKTGETLAVDPTIADYALIDFVSYEK
jgi:hypothetical protein